MSIFSQAYSPLLGAQGEIQGLLGGSSPAKLPDRPPIPQVQVRAPDYQTLARQGRQGGSGTGAAIGTGLGLLAAILAAYPSGGLSLSAVPGILGAGTAGGAVGGAIDS